MDKIIAVGTNKDSTVFYIEYSSGKKLKTYGELTKETEMLIRALQAEVALNFK